jgi:TetR/AcrR family transcriptional regulator, regulator of mycofactocin system
MAVEPHNEASAPARGRPPSITADQIGHVALALFATRGFEETTVDDIATALGISRRTVFRYFASKNDIVWGDFARVLDRLRDLLDATPADAPVMRALAHSMLRYVAWRHVVAEYVAARRGESTDALVPQTIAHALLGASTAAFVHWVDNPGDDLDANLRRAYGMLRESLALDGS